MRYRSSRTPRDQGREFRENVPESDSRRHPTRTTERPMNQTRLMPTARRALIAASSLSFALTACQDANGPDQRGPTSARVIPTPSAARNTIADEYIVVFNDDVADVDGR